MENFFILCWQGEAKNIPRRKLKFLTGGLIIFYDDLKNNYSLWLSTLTFYILQYYVVFQNHHFGGLNRHFKPNMRKIQIAVSSDLCIRLTWNLTGSCGQQQRLRGWSRTVVEQFQDGGRPPFWKSLYIHISAKNHPIFMTFCTQQQILNWVNVTWSKMKKLHWRDSEFDRTYFWFKIFSCTVYDLIINIQENKKKIFFRTYYILRDETYKM